MMLKMCSNVGQGCKAIFMSVMPHNIKCSYSIADWRKVQGVVFDMTQWVNSIISSSLNHILYSKLYFALAVWLIDVQKYRVLIPFY